MFYDYTHHEKLINECDNNKEGYFCFKNDFICEKMNGFYSVKFLTW